jgi:hypothetical protein
MTTLVATPAKADAPGGSMRSDSHSRDVNPDFWEMNVGPDLKTLLYPTHVYSASEILSRPCPVPNSPGVYAWYFDAPLPLIDMTGCHRVDGRALLYVGISPKAHLATGLPVARRCGNARFNTAPNTGLPPSINAKYQTKARRKWHPIHIQ